jgi:alanine dehydrogenase
LVSFEYIKDEDGRHLPCGTLIAEIAGTASILIAAELMITNEFEKDSIWQYYRRPPTEVV